MPAPAVDFLAAQLAKLQDYESRPPIDEHSTELLVRQRFVEEIGHSSITDISLEGVRKVVIVVNDLLITAQCQLPADPETLPRIAVTNWTALGRRPTAHVSRDTPFTPAQRRFLVASGFTFRTGKEATRNI